MAFRTKTSVDSTNVNTKELKVESIAKSTPVKSMDALIQKAETTITATLISARIIIVKIFV